MVRTSSPFPISSINSIQSIIYNHFGGEFLLFISMKNQLFAIDIFPLCAVIGTQFLLINSVGKELYSSIYVSMICFGTVI